MEKKQTKQPKTALVLRCCAPDMESKNGFAWPGVGEIAIAPDWRADDECGHGLHGWLYGQGDHGCSNYHERTGARWLVVEVEESDIRMLGGKCKFPRGLVRFVGEKHEATAFIIANEPRCAGVAVIGAHLVCGDEQTVMVGALGTATAGDSGTATAGDSGTATAGDSGEIHIRYWDSKNERYRTVVGYAGEDGIKKNTPYRLDAEHQFFEVTA